ncbi:kunitz-type protease inhibitor 1-like [Salarias fasciatus]|uniref:Kunitz-type protease inhibitor 1-like n=1 Tax=Salarias fasciatus TaxID=181472 RepID=A0A672HJY2_SALFA|nr:kunitz-type protease inhibitor 1-like [Salarias fasciatus]
MPSSSSSSSSSSPRSPRSPRLRPPLPLLLLLLLVRPGGAAEQQEERAAPCGLRRGKQDFLLDAQDALREGAVLLAAARVRSAEECERACCVEARCNVAQLDMSGGDTRTCTLFNCVRRNRFVCRLVHETGFQTYILDSVFRKYLEGPQGPGDMAPPIAITGRDVIVQPGVPVTLNGTESLALFDSQLTDYRWSQQSGGGVRMEATPLPDQVRLSQLRPGRFVFQLTVTDSNGQSHSSNTSVLVLSLELSSTYCLAQLSVGPCRAFFPRWRYNASSGVCERFVYGGCKGNKNNFLSEAECVSACSGVAVSLERRVAGASTEGCVSPCPPDQLTCEDGSLECDGAKQCRDGVDEDCRTLNQTLNQLLDIDVNQRKASCTEPPHVGPCRASLSRWFFNPLTEDCVPFTFGGCEANGNNFQDQDECRTRCRGVTERDVFSRGLFERFEKEEEEKESGSIALAVVLAVAVLALLAILTYCFLKSRRKRSHRPVATSPAHISLSEQDTLVYNSTTKPV